MRLIRVAVIDQSANEAQTPVGIAFLEEVRIGREVPVKVRSGTGSRDSGPAFETLQALPEHIVADAFGVLYLPCRSVLTHDFHNVRFLSSTLSVPTAPAGLPVPFPCDSARVYADVVFRHIMRQRFTFESTGNHHGSPAHVAVFGNPQIEQPQSHRAAPDPYDLMAGWQQHSHIGSLSHRTASAVRRLRW